MVNNGVRELLLKIFIELSQRKVKPTADLKQRRDVDRKRSPTRFLRFLL
jgi:hypothetical protein